MKLISYMYSYSGDIGFRPSNNEEWNGIEGHFYFDSEKWDMKKIFNIMKTLYRKYESFGTTWTLGEVIDHLRDTIVPFVNETDGVYVKGGLSGFKADKRINPDEHEIVSWEYKGKSCNYDYHK